MKKLIPSVLLLLFGLGLIIGSLNVESEDDSYEFETSYDLQVATHELKVASYDHFSDNDDAVEVEEHEFKVDVNSDVSINYTLIASYELVIDNDDTSELDNYSFDDDYWFYDYYYIYDYNYYHYDDYGFFDNYGYVYPDYADNQVFYDNQGFYDDQVFTDNQIYTDNQSHADDQVFIDEQSSPDDRAPAENPASADSNAPANNTPADYAIDNDDTFADNHELVGEWGLGCRTRIWYHFYESGRAVNLRNGEQFGWGSDGNLAATFYEAWSIDDGILTITWTNGISFSYTRVD